MGRFDLSLRKLLYKPSIKRSNASQIIGLWNYVNPTGEKNHTGYFHAVYLCHVSVAFLLDSWPDHFSDLFAPVHLNTVHFRLWRFKKDVFGEIHIWLIVRTGCPEDDLNFSALT
jgi:hypothetical protein